MVVNTRTVNDVGDMMPRAIYIVCCKCLGHRRRAVSIGTIDMPPTCRRARLRLKDSYAIEDDPTRPNPRLWR